MKGLPRQGKLLVAASSWGSPKAKAHPVAYLLGWVEEGC